MNGLGLFLLGRQLMQIANRALPSGQATTSVRLVLADITYHPESSISEITDRTGFPQSLVSTSVAKLQDIGVIEKESDPSDRRRTIVRTTAALEGFADRASRSSSIDRVLADALRPGEKDQLPSALNALNVLARLLIPEVLADEQLRSTREAQTVNEGAGR
jgi:DNA-binding MarR family transcriptional regulator